MATYPTAWSVEVIRNAGGHAWFYVSRFANRCRLEYLEDAAGNARAFRTRAQADAACTRANRAS